MAEAFTLIGGREHQETVFEDYESQQSAKSSNAIITILASVRAHHPDMTVAVTFGGNIDLLAYAAAGFASAELDISEGEILRARIFLRATSHDDEGGLADSNTFARYNYTWKGLKFVIYNVFMYMQVYQFVCFPPDSDETVQSNSKATDALLLEAGRLLYPYQDYIAVFDGYWRADTNLYKEVQKTSWSDVILDQGMKDTISYTIEEFFDNERYVFYPCQEPFLIFPEPLLPALLAWIYLKTHTDENSRYRDFDVPWKRGIIFHGPPGNGKTLSLRALMHSLISHEKQRPKPITLLYVKSISMTYHIRMIFSFARMVAPCLLLIEDIDTQITPDKLSYFFNEVDGLENNDGILMIATTNHLDKLDEGLKRPSRFDRRYFFPLPELDERTQYSEFWRLKLESHGAKVEFPKELSRKIAGITDGFSFATMKEAFIATLLALARNADDKEVASRDKGHDGIDDLPLWKEMQVQVKLLRKEMGKAHRVPQILPNFAQPAPALREASFSPPQEPYQRGPNSTLCTRGSHLRDYQSCERGSAVPFRGPPPAAMSGANVTMLTSDYFPKIPSMAGQDPAFFAGGSHPQDRSFSRLLGLSDVRDKDSELWQFAGISHM